MKLEEAEPQIPEEYSSENSGKIPAKWKAINSQDINEAETEDTPFSGQTNQTAFTIFRYLEPPKLTHTH